MASDCQNLRTVPVRIVEALQQVEVSWSAAARAHGELVRHQRFGTGRERRSFFYLVRVNGWAWFVVLVGLTTVDWDSLIVRYNLRHDNPGEIDIDNYLHMSDKVLPLLYADLDKVEHQMARHRNNRVRWVEHLDPAEFRRELDEKRGRFLQRYAGLHWQEYSWADHRTMAALKGAGLNVRP